MNIIETLKQLLDQSLHLQGRAAALQADTPLLDAVPELDSMGLVAVVGRIEDQFSVYFDDDDLVGENFETLERLAEVIRSKREG